MKQLLISIFLFSSLNSQGLAAKLAPSGEAPAPPPTKGGPHPWTDSTRVRVFCSNVGRALFRRWGNENFKSLSNLSCIVKIDRDGKILKFRQKKSSADHATNELFEKLINGLECDTRVLGSLDSATIEIELQTYPNGIIRPHTTTN